MKLHLAASVALVCMSVTPALAQTNVDAINKFSWSENCGFLNWRDGGSTVGTQGARIGFKILSGFVWGENIGWIDLGDGTPANGQQYANPTSGPVVGIPDFGVNRDPATNALSGFAWGENVGWVNFSGGALATPAQPARFDPIAKRLRGYCWGENIGWINLDHSAVFVGMIFYPADFNGVNGVEVQDIFDFLAAWFAGDPRANFNGANGIEVQDIFDFLAAWFAGC